MKRITLVLGMLGALGLAACSVEQEPAPSEEPVVTSQEGSVEPEGVPFIIPACQYVASGACWDYPAAWPCKKPDSRRCCYRTSGSYCMR